MSRKVGGLKAGAAFSSWLFTVIKRECRKLERMMFRTEVLHEDMSHERQGYQVLDGLTVTALGPVLLGTGSAIAMPIPPAAHQKSIAYLSGDIGHDEST